MNFLNALEDNMNKTRTENGASALRTTDSAVLDLFGIIGGLRNRSHMEIETLFAKAFAEDPHLAMKLLFYARDIRGGLGERRIARILYKYLANIHTETLRKNLKIISEYGRWDDLLVLLDTPLKDDVIELIRTQLLEDLEAERPSLMAKWLPSINASSNETTRLAKTIMKGLSFDAQKYRKTLVGLRKKVDVLEVKMSSGNWEAIDYEKVPSNAMNIYSRAFMTRDEKRFGEYINAVKSDKKTINASVLYPYNVVEKILYGGNTEAMDVMEQQWYNMPDFVEGNDDNTIVMADVSGSMYGRPMATSIGLALYFAERSSGAFKDYFMTFSESPSLIKVTGNTFYDRVRMVMGSNWGMNTNFEKALRVILKTAVKKKAMQEDLPKTIIVVTDMQFDVCTGNASKDWTFYEKIKKLYKYEGYTIPAIVFWNVNSVSNVFQTTSRLEGVKMASGQSPSVFKSILKSKSLTSYDFMLEVLNQERYEAVTA